MRSVTPMKGPVRGGLACLLFPAVLCGAIVLPLEPAVARLMDGAPTRSSTASRLDSGDWLRAGREAAAAGRIVAARIAFSRALDLGRLDDRPHHEALALSELAKLTVRAGDARSMRVPFQDAQRIASEIVEDGVEPVRLKRALIHVWIELGDRLANAGHGAASRPVFAAAAGLAHSLARANPHDAGAARAHAMSLERLAVLAGADHNVDSALAYQQAAVAQRGAVERIEANESSSRALMLSLQREGDLRREGGIGDAGASYRQALGVGERLLAADPDNVVKRRDLARIWLRIAAFEREHGHPQDALNGFGRAREEFETLSQAQPARTLWREETARTVGESAELMTSLGRPHEAMAALGTCLRLRRELASANPADPRLQRELIKAWEAMARAREDADDRVGAQAAWRSALGIAGPLRARFPDDHANAEAGVVPMVNLARHLSEGDPVEEQEARRLYRQALEILRPLAREGRLDERRTQWLDMIEEGLAPAGR